MNYSYSIGISAIGAGQRALDVIGQNVANANTDGYHRQEIGLVSEVVDPRYGTGVKVAQVRRFTADSVREALRASTSESERISARLDSQNQVESLFRPGTGAIDSLLEGFFNQVEQLTARPEDVTQRRILIADADVLANQFNTVASDLDKLRSSLSAQVSTTVDDINELLPQIADLSVNILKTEAAGGQANDLRDQRDQLINDLAEMVDIRVTTQDKGSITIMSGNTPLVVGDNAANLVLSSGPTGNLIITDSISGQALQPRGGSLAGLLDEHNTKLSGYRSQLDQLAQTLIQTVDGVQSTGLGKAGPTTFMAGTRSVANTGVPLATLNLPIAPQAGDLAISVTDTATGQRTLTSIAIDPATQSLQDIATAITTATGGQVTGSINPADNTLELQALTGFTFDFAGRIPTSPTSVAMNGTSVPQVTGTFLGAANDTYDFQIVGNGTIGTTAGMQLEVRDSASSLLAIVNVGSGYTPGDPLDIGNGLTVRLSAGTSNNGTFSIPVTALADTANILPALGVNSFFTGFDATSIAVRDDLLNDPTMLSVSRSGQSGDVGNLQRMADLRDAKLLAAGTQTLREYYTDLTGEVGLQVQSLTDQQDAQSTLDSNLIDQEQSVVGVDMNEELLNLLRYQRMVEAASRYLNVVDTTMDSILDIIK